MNDAATPPVETTPVVPAPGATPAPAVETVTLTKAQHDQLARDAARAAANQRKADLYDKTNGTKGKGYFPATAPATPPSKEEMEARASEEDRKAERGILALVADPNYRDVFDADPTLRNLALSNPLAILPLYANDAVDAEDALALVKESLDKLKKPAPATPANPATTPTTTPPTATPPAGGINPPSSDFVDEAYELAKKNPNTEHAVAGMIGAKMKKQGK